MTIKNLLDQNKDIKDNIKKELLSDVLNISKSDIILNYDKKISTKDVNKYLKDINKIKKGLPIQYALNKAYFYGKDYYVDKNVLIPRPETEVLVKYTNDLIKQELTKDNINILDIGTGSGVIAITLKLLNKNYDITANDISKKALKVAKYNAKHHKVDINFIKSNILDNIKDKYDVIISNPPYIKEDSTDIEDIVKNNEPKIALYAKNNGLYFYEEIIKNSKDILNKENILAFETGEDMHQELTKIVNKYYPNAKIISKKDLNNYERYLFVINK